MPRVVHAVQLPVGSLPANEDRVILGMQNVANPAGNGAVTAIAAGSPGAGYHTIPTVAFAGVSNGVNATATAVMKVLTATVAAGGTGGTPGAVTITGATGTGTKFQATGTITEAGALAGALVVTVVGAYTAMPSSLTVEAVTGGSLSGATVALSMGVASYTIGAGGTNYPVAGVTAALTGGTPTTAAVPGAVTVTTAAGYGCAVPVTWENLPAAYCVQVQCGQDAVAYVDPATKAASGFTVTLMPRLASQSIAAGTIDVQVVA